MIGIPSWSESGKERRAGKPARAGNAHYERAAGGAWLGAGPDGARHAAARSLAGGALAASRPAGLAATRRSTRSGAAPDEARCA